MVIFLIVYLVIGVLSFGFFSSANNDMPEKDQIKEKEKPAMFMTLVFAWPVVVVAYLGAAFYRKLFVRKGGVSK